MSIPINNLKIHRLARELRDADLQLQLAYLRRQTLQADLEAAKATLRLAQDVRRNEAEKAAAVAEVCRLWGVEL